MNGVTVPNATHGNASGSVTPTMARPLSIEMPGLWLMMNSMTYEPMFMLAILPVAAMGAIASVIDDDAARWINGASKDIMNVRATHGKASGSVTPTMARPLSMDIPGLWLMYEEVSS
jgi:hypothetical protein